MTVESVKETEAKVFGSDKALELGLIDKIMTNTEFKNTYLLSTEDKEKKGKSYILATEANATVVDVDMSNIKSQEENIEMTENQGVDMAAYEEMVAKLAAFESAANATALQAKQDEVVASLSTATFLSNTEATVAFLMNAEAAQADMLHSVIADANTKMAEMAANHVVEVEKLAAEHGVAVAALNAKAEEAVAEKELIKEEFAAPAAVQGEVEELTELSHKEKLAKAVASAKAKKSI